MWLRWSLLALVLFIFAVFLSWTLTGYPALAFAAVLITTLYAVRNEPDSALIFGAVTGLLLDIFGPEVPGINLLALGVVAYIISYASDYFHLGNPLWYFMAGVISFSIRFMLVAFYHLVTDGSFVYASQFRGSLSAALWTGIICAFAYYFLDRYFAER